MLPICINFASFVAFVGLSCVLVVFYFFLFILRYILPFWIANLLWVNLFPFSQKGVQNSSKGISTSQDVKCDDSIVSDIVKARQIIQLSLASVSKRCIRYLPRWTCLYYLFQLHFICHFLILTYFVLFQSGDGLARASEERVQKLETRVAELEDGKKKLSN